MHPVNSVIRYFDLFSNRRTLAAKAQSTGLAGPSVPSSGWLIAHYAALLLGILAKVYLDSRASPPMEFSWDRMIVAVVVALSVFPAVYKTAAGSTDPGFVQLCVTFTTGLGYKTLIDIKV